MMFPFQKDEWKVVLLCSGHSRPPEGRNGLEEILPAPPPSPSIPNPLPPFEFEQSGGSRNTLNDVEEVRTGGVGVGREREKSS